MNKNTRGLIIIFGIIIGIVALSVVVQNIVFSQTISLEVVADPSIEKIELFALKQEQTILLALQPGESDQTRTVTLRVNEPSNSPFDRPVVRYYAFIMTKDGNRYQSDAFNFSGRSDKLRLNIGMAGSWEIVNR